MFDHVTIRVSDRAASERFYTRVLAVLGIDQTHSGGQFTEWNDFSLSDATAWNPVTTGLHIGVRRPSPARVDEFWQAGIDAGYESDGEPGPRPKYGDGYYGGFLLDPDGNSAEAVHLRTSAAAWTTCGSAWPTCRVRPASTRRSPRSPVSARRSARAARSSPARARARSRC